MDRLSTSGEPKRLPRGSGTDIAQLRQSLVHRISVEQASHLDRRSGPAVALESRTPKYQDAPM
jgi:hypothetical protein